MWGGSYGGIGGFPFTGFHIPYWPSSSGAAYGSALDPAQPGEGGAASSESGVYGGAGAGAPGGGFIRLDGGTVALDGSLSANGAAVNGDGGGAGSGGGISVHADKLSGRGSVSADGGSVCCGATGAIGGPGGGGRVAFIGARHAAGARRCTPSAGATPTPTASLARPRGPARSS
jgi:hypothetical protein